MKLRACVTTWQHKDGIIEQRKKIPKINICHYLGGHEIDNVSCNGLRNLKKAIRVLLREKLIIPSPNCYGITTPSIGHYFQGLDGVTPVWQRVG